MMYRFQNSIIYLQTRRSSATREGQRDVICYVSWNLVNSCTTVWTRVSAAADRPAHNPKREWGNFGGNMCPARLIPLTVANWNGPSTLLGKYFYFNVNFFVKKSEQ